MKTLTLSDVKGPVARMLNMSPDDERVVEYINQAIEMMVTGNNVVNLDRIMSIRAKDGVLTMPIGVSHPIKFSVDNVVGQVFGRHYEYVMNGPGLSADWPYSAKDLVDMGFHPFIIDEFDPAYLRINFATHKCTSTDQMVVLVEGIGEDGYAVKTVRDGKTVPYEMVQLHEKIDFQTGTKYLIGQTIAKFTKITSISSLVQSNSIGTIDTGGIIFDPIIVGQIYPGDASVMYRKFRLHGVVDADDDGIVVVNGLFRMEPRNVKFDEETLLVNSIGAIKLGVKAILHYENDEIEKAATMEGIIERMLKNQYEFYETADNILDIDEGYGNGDI